MTAEEFINKIEESHTEALAEFDEGGYLGIREELLYRFMVNFAKHHVREALKEAQYMADCKEISCEESNQYYRERILNAYPDDKIK